MNNLNKKKNLQHIIFSICLTNDAIMKIRCLFYLSLSQKTFVSTSY